MSSNETNQPTLDLDAKGHVDPDETIVEDEEETLAAGGLKKKDAEPQGGKAESKTEDSGTEEEGEESSSSSDDGGMYAGLTAQQKKLMKAKFAAMQAGYADAMKQQRDVKVKEIQNQFKFAIGDGGEEVSDALAGFILDFTTRQEMNLREKLDQDAVVFLRTMREMHKEAEAEEAKKAANAKKNDGDYKVGSDEEDDSTSCDDGPESGLSDLNFDEGEDWVKDVLRRKKAHQEKRKKANVAKGQKLDGTKRTGRLLLDEALKDKTSMEGWSVARQKAFKNIKTNPNAYYYRFNAPGEKQGGGGFTLEERKIFMLRMKELGVNNKWGVFSMKIPGRVGYQCSNFYRILVKNGDIRDPNYHYDGKKLHFKRNVKKPGMSDKQFEAIRFYNFTIIKDPTGVWKNLPARHEKAPKIEEVNGEVRLKPASSTAGAAAGDAAGAAAAEARKGKRKRKARAPRRPAKKKKRVKNDSDTDSDVDIRVKEMESDSDDEYGNPIPDFIDPINGCPVEQPAISPYGHVCGYSNWTKILRTGKFKNTCPFTKKPLGRRELVKLTRANYDEFKDKIINNASLS